MTRIPVLVAIGDAAAEQRFVAACADPAAVLQVVRRCVDLADLLSAGATGIARVAVVGGLRRFDAAAVDLLRADGVQVAALAGDDEGRALRGMGVRVVLPAASGPDAIAAELRALGGDRPPARAEPTVTEPVSPRDPGRVLVVWGPHGAPGRTLAATSLAAEFAALGLHTLLVDADTYAASVGQLLGLLDEVPGVAAAARASNLGRLDAETLLGHASRLAFGGPGRLHVLTGLPAAERWPELRPAALQQILDLGRTCLDVVVVDCAACLEQDEELSHDLLAPRRNGAARTALAAADVVLAVGAADPVGLGRLVRALPDLARAAPVERTRVVVNRVRRGPVAGAPEREIGAVLDRFAGIGPVTFLPEDRASADGALATGRLLVECAPDSPLRLALRALAAELAGRAEAPRTGRRGRRRAARRRASARVTMSG